MNWRFGFLKEIVLGYDRMFSLASIHPHGHPFLQGMTFDECNDGRIHGSEKREESSYRKKGLTVTAFGLWDSIDENA
jgi:hypothetical protein